SRAADCVGARLRASKIGEAQQGVGCIGNEQRWLDVVCLGSHAKCRYAAAISDRRGIADVMCSVRALSSGKLSIAAALLPSAFVMGSRFSSCTSCAVVKPSPSV